MIHAFRAAHATDAEVLLAEHLLQEVCDSDLSIGSMVPAFRCEATRERGQWEEIQPKLHDGRFVVLSAMAIEAGSCWNSILLPC